MNNICSKIPEHCPAPGRPGNFAPHLGHPPDC